MFEFVVIAGAAAIAVAIFIARPMLSRRGLAVGRDEADAQVFRDQLDELERDVTRGTISEAEAEGARIEISRRLIQASDRAEGAGRMEAAPPSVSKVAAVLSIIALPVAAAALYAAIGAPWSPDQPLASRASDPDARPSQERAEAMIAGQVLAPPTAPDPEFVALVERLEAVTRERPDDARGQQMLAGALMQLGRWADARKAYDRFMELAGASADAEMHANHAEAMVLAAGGYVSPEAERAISRALELDPRSMMARYYAALALRQAGRSADALAIWQRIRAESPPDAPWLPSLDALIAETGGPAAPAIPGPSAEDIEAASEMSEEDRAAMIEGMVARLEDRLTTEGGTVEEWVRLVTVYTRLGREDDALRAYALGREAQTEDTARAFLKEQALLLGLPLE